MKNKGLNLEEILNQKVHDDELLEVPLRDGVLKFYLAIAGAFFLVAFGYLVFLGIIRRAFYSERAFVNANQIVILNPLRGVIFDRFNKPLIQNEEIFNIILIPSALPKDLKERNNFYDKITETIDMSRDELKLILKNTNPEAANRILLKKIADPQKMLALKALNSRAIQIEGDFQRFYPDDEIFSHLFGYLGAAAESDLKEKDYLSFTDDIGQTGLESVYDRDLRGQTGKLVRFRDARGNFLEEKILTSPTAGQSLKTNIDGELQRYFHNSLKKGLQKIGSFAGVGLAINPQNGEILALISLPDFNPNIFNRFENKKALDSLLNDFQRPLFNRAISGLYNPGSTIKPLVATAALAEGVIKPEKEIFSAGFIEIPNPYNPDKPSRFLDWKPHGWVNLYSALARSSNVYFYSVGGGFDEIEGLGINKLMSWWRLFGLGQTSGVDLAGEKEGFLPDPKIKKGSRWLLGDTYNVSIGQGDLLLTPLQLLNSITAIANGGFVYKPMVKQGQPEILYNLSRFKSVLQKVEKGMLETTQKTYGTAYIMRDLPMSVAAKTGSAQTNNNKKINALFLGYAPVPDPQIAVLVLVEDAKEGSLNAAPIAKEVLAWYYENRIK